MSTTLPSRGFPGLMIQTFFITLSASALYFMRLSPPSVMVGKHFENVIATLEFPGVENYRLRAHYTGISGLDYGLSFLVAAFLPGAGGFSKAFQIQQFYFLISFFSIIAVWSVDAGRKRNRMSSLYWTSIWAIFYQTVGGAVVIPLYYLAYLSTSKRNDYFSTTSRPVSTTYAKALIPALIVGYLLPTIIMYLPFPDPDLSITQALVAFWQPTPFFVNIILYIMATWVFSDDENTTSLTGDLPYINFLYFTCLTVAAISHLFLVRWCWLSEDPTLTLKNVFGLVEINDNMTMFEGLHFIFQVDYWFIFAAAVFGMFVSIWDLKKVGKTDLSMIELAAMMTISVVMVGPAATVAGFAYMREHIMAEKEKK